MSRRIAWLGACAALLACACARQHADRTPAGAPAHATADEDAGADDAGVALLGAPYPFAPTAHGFGINAVVGTGAASGLRCYVRPKATSAWGASKKPATPADDVAQWTFSGLKPATRYEYKIVNVAEGRESALYRGEVVTQRPKGAAFGFVLITDTHISPREVSPGETDTNDYAEATLAAVAEDVTAAQPDFVIHLGDTLDFHLFGFNDPPPDGRYTKQAYLNYRRLLGEGLGRTAHFSVIGNWDGENGDYTSDEIERSRAQRLLYAPGPTPDTYPEGGSKEQDYYAFTWGDALFVVLNVMTYTTTAHRLDYDPGLPDDWTLGEAQLSWLTTTLEQATSKWKFLFIHHTVAGAAGDDTNSAYGRGGGQAAHVGEQAVVHELMMKNGAQIFFYGHDHVFTDTVVDGIHYTLPGSAGAPWKFTTSETGYTDYWPDSGYARVHVSPDQVEVEFVSLGGDVLYSYTVD